jgi:hypothetical protein
MPGPLHWFRNPQKLSDDTLVDQLVSLLVQCQNRTWREDPIEYPYLEGRVIAHLKEVEKRIAQGTLFD